MTDDQLQQAKQLIAQGKSQRQAALMLNIPKSTLEKAHEGQTSEP